MSVTLTQQVPAFRMDDATLERLWSVLEAKCAEAGPPTGRLTVRERDRGAGAGRRRRTNTSISGSIVALVAIVFLQLWSALAFQFAFMALILNRDRIFPAADIRVERRHERIATLESGQAAGGQPHPGPTEDRGTGESPARARREPAPRDRDGIATLSDYRKRSEGGDTTVH